MTEPKTTRARRRVNESTDGHLGGAELRERNTTERRLNIDKKVAAEWRAYRQATPIAVETFVPVLLCQALDELAEAVGGEDGDEDA